MRRTVVLLVLVVAISGCTSPPPPSLTDEVGSIPADVDDAISSVREILAQRYDSLPLLYRRLEDERLPTTMAVLYDQAGRIESTAAPEDTARFEGFVGEVLLATEGLDHGIATEDLVEIGLTWLRIEAAAGALAVGIEPENCSVLVPTATRDLCRTPGLTDYEAGVDEAIRLFLARYRPVLRLPEAFGPTVQGWTVAILSGEVVAVIDAALADLAALEPPVAYRGVHDAFVGHLEDLRVIWSDVEPGVTDPLLWNHLADELADAACVAEEDYLDGRALLLGSHPDSAVPALGRLWLQNDLTGCP